MKSNASFFCFVTHTFGIMSKNLISKLITPMFSSREFYGLVFFFMFYFLAVP